MSEPLLTIRNHHTAFCGDPPVIADDSESYLGYFENPDGEQWIFAFDRATRVGELRGGDIGWNERVSVRDGNAENLVLRDAERLWLRACWLSVTAE